MPFPRAASLSAWISGRRGGGLPRRSFPKEIAMRVAQATAPAPERFRAMKSVNTPTFPVYSNLADTLVSATSHPDPTIAHVLATCSGYAYAEEGAEGTVAMMMARLGLAENRCLKVSEDIDAMFICSNAFVVQSHCGRAAILCYRGTDPDDFMTWLTDADVNPEKVSMPFPGQSEPFEMHGGFYRNVRATRHEIVAALERALRGQSILTEGGEVPNKLEALYLAGHSLGGAMAAIMGAMLVMEPAYAALADKLRAVYTFGQPMVGDPRFARCCREHRFLSNNVIRYIYGHDIVTEMPPTASGEFAHFGREYRFTEGRWMESVKPIVQANFLEAASAVAAIVTKQVRMLRNLPFTHSLYDHYPRHYIAALT